MPAVPRSLSSAVRIEQSGPDRHDAIATDDHGHPEHALVAVALRRADGWVVINTIGSEFGATSENAALALLTSQAGTILGILPHEFNAGRHLDDDGLCCCMNRCCFGGFDDQGRAVCVCSECTITHDAHLFAPHGTSVHHQYPLQPWSKAAALALRG